MAALDPRRSTVLTATNMTVLMGAVPDTWGTPYDIYLDKIGLGAPLVMTHRMAMGQLAEPYIAFIYSKEGLSGGESLADGEFTQHPLLPLGGTPDRIVMADGKPVRGLEIKRVAFNYDKEWGEPGSSEVPLKVRVQCQHYMNITGLREWDVAVLLEDRDVYIYHVEHDDALQAEMDRVATNFWMSHVLPKIPPERGKAKMPDALVTLAKTGSAVAAPDDPRILELGKEANRLKIMADSTKKELESVLLELREAMVSHHYRGVSNGWTATIIGINPKPKVDWETVAMGMQTTDPDRFQALLEAHTTRPEPTTQFRFKAKGLPSGEEK